MNGKINLLESLYIENKLSHAILIETNNQDACYNELKNVIKTMSCLSNCCVDHKCSTCRLIDKDESLNFFVVQPDGKNIKKEQILEIQSRCSVMPVLSKNNIYVIKNAETMNASSFNTMLKFIEEPVSNCYGFLITNSKENIISTIRSRCEIYKINYDNADFLQMYNISEEEYDFILENLKDYLYESINKGDIIINKVLLKEELKEKQTAKSLFLILLDIFNYYSDLYLNKDVNDKYLEFSYLKDVKFDKLIEKKAIVIKIINNMSYNLNIDLVFDKFVIEMGNHNE